MAISDYQLTCHGVAQLLGRHVQYVRYLAKAGKIPGVKICGQWRFNELEIEACLLAAENSPAASLNAMESEGDGTNHSDTNSCSTTTD